MGARLGWLILLLQLLRTHAAAACGVWWLQDEERGQSVSFYIRSTFLLSTAAREAGQPAKNRILLIEGETADRLHTEQGGRVQLDIREQALRLRGQSVGVLRGDELIIGRSAYRIAVALSPEAVGHPEKRQERWLVEVRRGDRRIAHGKAMAMCLGGLQGAEDAQQELEVRRRVIFYLAWRELLAKQTPPGVRPAR